jgi:uncharacterized membrane protein
MSEAHEERELIYASFADATMGVVAEKALREWDHQIDSVHVGNIAVVSRDEDGEVHVHQAGHISPSRGALFGLIAGGLVGAALIGLPLTVAVGTAAGVQAAAVAAGALTSAAASAQATALATGAGLATAVGSAVTGAVGAALGTAAGGIASLFGFKSEELNLVGAELEANRSAVILLVKADEVDAVCDFLIRMGASVRRGSVSESLLDLATQQAEAEHRESATAATSGVPSEPPASALGG